MTNAEKFITDLFHSAIRIENQYGIPHSVLLAQAALETGYGQSVPDNSNMYFGIKAGSNWGGKRILVTTTEILPSNTGYEFPQVLSITPYGNQYKWKVKDWFRAYNTPYESLKDYAKLITDSSAYQSALQFKDDPVKFIEQLGAYATDPNYIQKVKDVRQGILSRIEKLELKKKIIPFGLILSLGVILYIILKK